MEISKETKRQDIHRPLVTIVTPTFNREYILGRAIESVLGQTYPNWEHIIVDDGSTDGTAELVASYNDPRIIYLVQQNKGPSAARNRALSAAHGEWVSYIDSDNELYPNYLETMMRSVDQVKGAVFAISCGNRTQELYKDDKLLELIDDSADFPANLTAKDIGLRTHHFDINGFMHSYTVIRDGVRFDEEMRSLEDWDFAIQIAEKYPDGFVYVKDLLFHYHQRYGTDGLVSNATYGDWANSFDRIYQKHKGDNILKGQTWHPARVEKYRSMQADFEAGRIPPQYLMIFSNPKSAIDSESH